jgi:hypothetical protein
MNSDLFTLVTFRYIWYKSFSLFSPQFVQIATLLCTLHLELFQDEQFTELHFKAKFTSCTPLHVRLRYYLRVCRYLWLIFDSVFYSFSEFRDQGKIPLNSLAFWLTKVFCACVGSGLTTVQKKKGCSARPETDIWEVLRHIKEIWKKGNIGSLYLKQNLRMAKCQIGRDRERRNLNGDNSGSQKARYGPRLKTLFLAALASSKW